MELKGTTKKFLILTNLFIFIIFLSNWLLCSIQCTVCITSNVAGYGKRKLSTFRHILLCAYFGNIEYRNPAISIRKFPKAIYRCSRLFISDSIWNQFCDLAIVCSIAHGSWYKSVTQRQILETKENLSESSNFIFIRRFSLWLIII